LKDNVSVTVFCNEKEHNFTSKKEGKAFEKRF